MTMDPAKLAIFYDAFNLLCDKKLGGGISRDVFECRIDRSLVVKVEIETNWRMFSNWSEMQFWCDNQYNPKIAKWLAPCEYMSPDGRIMLQKRVKPVSAEDLPDMMPAFLTDLKPANFGMLNGQIVCVDYARTVVNSSYKLKKVQWRE